MERQAHAPMGEEAKGSRLWDNGLARAIVGDMEDEHEHRGEPCAAGEAEETGDEVAP